MRYPEFVIHRNLAIACLLAVLCIPAAVRADWYKDEQAIMGTRIAVEFWADKTIAAQDCGDAVMSEMRRIDALMSPYREDSELSLVNREADSQAVTVSRELFSLIQQAQHISKLSNGAFDITYASVGHLYDYRKSVKPSDRKMQQIIRNIDYHLIKLDSENLNVRFDRSGVRIDLGGIAKGYAVDNGIRILEKCGVKTGIVTAGGDSRIIGDRRGYPWMIGVRNPRDKDGFSVVLPLSDTAVSTSGDYERYFIEDGQRYHHIINPSTGESVSSVMSVTVIGPDALTTDALSTTVFVLGPVEGLALIESLEGLDAVIIDPEGRLQYSSGLMPPTKKATSADK